MVVQPVDGRDGHGLVRKDLIPAAERLICRDGDVAVFVAPGDQREQNSGFGLWITTLRADVRCPRQSVEAGQWRVSDGDIPGQRHEPWRRP